jgi:hypothetical protein
MTEDQLEKAFEHQKEEEQSIKDKEDEEADEEPVSTEKQPAPANHAEQPK